MQWNVLHTKKITRKPSSRLWETLNLVLCGMVRREVTLPGFPVQFWPWVSVCVKFQIFSLFLPGFPRSSVVSYHHPKSINVGRLSVSKLSIYVTACAWCPWMDFSLSLSLPRCQDRLPIYCNPEQDKVVSKEERMNFSSRSFKGYQTAVENARQRSKL